VQGCVQDAFQQIQEGDHVPILRRQLFTTVCDLQLDEEPRLAPDPLPLCNVHLKLLSGSNASETWAHKTGHAAWSQQ
jgi:hypothetical protein